ncbi:unnamed protein product [Microthlaspi erraticum]|uniref:Uncharacterized protein n=1 Tax=Microthlaspi erraticum TaxID=1685480 RepID=A0A6D2JUT7_9BRAS|nr:unnamed protein product [Microthlaspi erraticum]
MHVHRVWDEVSSSVFAIEVCVIMRHRCESIDPWRHSPHCLHQCFSQGRWDHVRSSAVLTHHRSSHRIDVRRELQTLSYYDEVRYRVWQLSQQTSEIALVKTGYQRLSLGNWDA